jgi:ubiquinone biosynthesis monooxygenase Coq6
MQIWDGVSDARITFSASELPLKSVTELSRLTENLNLQRGLLRHLSQSPEVQILDKVKVQTIEREDREENAWPLVQLSDGRVIRTRLLVSGCMHFPDQSLHLYRSVQMAPIRLSGHTQA